MCRCILQVSLPACFSPTSSFSSFSLWAFDLHITWLSWLCFGTWISTWYQSGSLRIPMNQIDKFFCCSDCSFTLNFWSSFRIELRMFVLVIDWLLLWFIVLCSQFWLRSNWILRWLFEICWFETALLIEMATTVEIPILSPYYIHANENSSLKLVDPPLTQNNDKIPSLEQWGWL